MRFGIDVSHWQYPPDTPGANSIDYDLAIAAGVEFVVCRTTNGKTYDFTFQDHFDGAVDAGLMAAGYHYFRPRYGNQGQLDSIMENLDGRKPAFYTLDVETADGRETNEVRNDVGYMLNMLDRELDCPVIVYTAEWFWGNWIRDKIFFTDYRGQPNPRANYWRLWVATYPTDLNGTQLAMPEGIPVMPRGWRLESTGNGPYKGKWEIWQYTSKLMLPGVGGSMTLDGNIMEERFWVECGGEADPVDPVDPVDPIDPVDPVDPTDPVVPKTGTVTGTFTGTISL